MHVNHILKEQLLGCMRTKNANTQHLTISNQIKHEAPET